MAHGDMIRPAQIQMKTITVSANLRVIRNSKTRHIAKYLLNVTLQVSTMLLLCNCKSVVQYFYLDNRGLYSLSFTRYSS